MYRFQQRRLCAVEALSFKNCAADIIGTRFESGMLRSLRIEEPNNACPIDREQHSISQHLVRRHYLVAELPKPAIGSLLHLTRNEAARYRQKR